MENNVVSGFRNYATSTSMSIVPYDNEDDDDDDDDLSFIIYHLSL